MAAEELDEDGELGRYEKDSVKNIISWFNENIEAPSLLSDSGNNRCIAWFKPEAKKSLNLMWELYHILQSKGIAVEVLKSDDIGEIRYEDEHQVIAQPHRHNRKRHY